MLCPPAQLHLARSSTFIKMSKVSAYTFPRRFRRTSPLCFVSSSPSSFSCLPNLSAHFTTTFVPSKFQTQTLLSKVALSRRQHFLATFSSQSNSLHDINFVNTNNSPNSTTTTTPTISFRPLRKGDSVDVVITRIGYGGASVGRITSTSTHINPDDFDLPIYAPKGACPGDLIRCTISKVRRKGSRPNGLPVKPPPDADPTSPSSPRSYAEAMFDSLIQPSSHTVPVPCKHFGHFRLGGSGCGGCSSMHMAYDLQLQQKDMQIQTLFSAIAKLHDVTIQHIIPCEEIFYYRNKMEFTFGKQWHTVPLKMSEDSDGKTVDKQSTYALGLHVPLRFDKILEISQCHIYPSVGNQILDVIRHEVKEMLLEPFDAKKNTGYMRNVGIRMATNKHGKLEIMVNLITSPCDVPQRLQPLADRLINQFPDIICVLQNIRGEKGIYVIDESNERLLSGSRRYIEQDLSGLTFRISANSFFQTNPKQASILFDLVSKAANLSSHDVVLDLFCGTGSIGLSLAKYAAHVYGIDVVPSAITDANVNAKLNNVTNATFLQIDLEKIKEAKRKNYFNFPIADVVVVDPPRAGLHPDLIKYLSATSTIKRIVYVSCNPMTQVRDIMELMHMAPDTFRISYIQPVDMFPNTHHVECITAIERIPK